MKNSGQFYFFQHFKAIFPLVYGFFFPSPKDIFLNCFLERKRGREGGGEKERGGGERLRGKGGGGRGEKKKH